MTEHREVDPSTEPVNGRNRPRRLAAVGVIGALAVGAGVFGITTMNGSDGPASPEDAVEVFFDAVEDQDVIGLLEAVTPRERPALRRTVDGVLAEADRAEVTAEVDLRDVEGVDLRVVDLAHETIELADGMAGVDLTTGAVEADVDLDDLPIGRTIRNVLDPDATVDDAATLDLSGLRVMTVEDGGSWYVSLAYTGAEALRRSLDPVPDVPSFAPITGATGGDSPEDVVMDLAAAIDDLDLAAMIALTSPTRARVLHDYGPMLIDAAGELRPDEVALTDVELSTSDGPDGATLVTVTGYELTFEQSDGTTTYRFADGCLVTSFDYDDAYAEEDHYSESVFPDEVDSCDPPESEMAGIPGIFGSAGLFGFGVEAPTFAVVEEDGRWYLDALDSVGTSLVEMLADRSSDELASAVHWLTGADWLVQPAELWEACGVEEPGPDVDRESGRAALQQCFEQLPADYSGSWSMTANSTFEGPFMDGGLYDEGTSLPCWDTPDPDEMDACLVEEVDAGTIDARILHEFRCGRDLDEEWTEADFDAYDECVAAIPE